MSLSTITDLLTARVADLVSDATAQAYENSDHVLANALLDFRHAVSSGVPEIIIRSFMDLRPALERVDFMTAFRIRRRLESQYRLEVTVPGCEPSVHLLDLRWRTWPLLVGSAKRAVFEASECDSPGALLSGMVVRVL